ncbi:hypothetical protein HDU96_009981 [Phlyctochytrium bullatum]|nr:hypothetical protein HDU96_009981 [Phlyctochytrium bullatum]
MAFQDLPLELIQRSLVYCKSFRTSIAVELLASYQQPFWIRISDEPEMVRDAIDPLLPPQWSGLGPRNFLISTNLASELVVLRWNDVATIPAYIVAWVARFTPKLFTYDFVTAAAQAGRLDLIRLLHAFKIPKFCVKTMDAASKAGRLDVVRFLHFERTEGCTVSAMDDAIVNGHLDVAWFLGTHRTELCTDVALDTAVRNGDVDTVRFLQTVVKCEPNLQQIARVPDLKTLKILHEELGWPITSALAVCCGHSSVEAMAVVNEFFPNEECLWASRNWDSLAQRGDLQHLEWLYANRKEGCSPDIMKRLAMFDGDPDVIKFLETKGFEPQPSPPTPETPMKPGFLPPAVSIEYSDDALSSKKVKFGVLTEFFSPVPCEPSYVDVVLSAVEKGLKVHKKQLYLALAIATKWRSMETIEHLSNLTATVAHRNLEPTLAPIDLFLCPAILGRLEVIRFLHVNRLERPKISALVEAARKGHIEVVRYLVKKMRMEPTRDVLLEAADEVIPFLVDNLPAEADLDDYIHIAFSRDNLELLRWLHKKGLGTGRFPTMLVVGLDILKELVHIYGEQLEDQFVRMVIRQHGYDNVKFMMESELGKTLKLLLFHLLVFGSPDLILYTLDNNRYKIDDAFYFHDLGKEFHCHPYLYDDLADSSQLSFLNVAAGASNAVLFARLFARHPEQCTTRTAELAARTGNFSIVLLISKHAPHVITDSVVTHAIEGRCVFEIIEYLLQHHPSCRNPCVHLEAATRLMGSEHSDRADVVKLLLSHGWDAGCPSASVVNACEAGHTDVLRIFWGKVNLEDAAWRDCLKDCCRVLGEREDNAKMKYVLEHAKRLLHGVPPVK